MNDNNFIKRLWLQNLRWVAISVQLILIFPAFKFGYLTATNLPFFLATIFILFLFNIILTKSKSFIFKDNITVHLIFDLIIFTTLILLTAKIENPFWPFIYFHAALAAILLPLKNDHYYLPFLFGSISVVHASSLEYYSSVAFILLPQWLVLIAMWFLSRHLSLYLARQNKKIQELSQKEFHAQKLKSLVALSSGILHEMATPLNTIRLKTDRLKSKGLNAFSDQDLSALDSSLTDVENIVNYLNQSQYEVETESMVKFNILEALNQIADRYPQIQFKINATSNPLFLSVAPVRLKLVLDIIIKNAIEAKASQLIFNFAETENSLEVQISDNGPGFDTFILENFGAPYTTTKGRGHGNGLFSSLLSIEAMGGKMQISNTKQGACVSLTLERFHEN
jgi:two-component system sensor histidine kinase RegB